MLISDKLKIKENFSSNECTIADYLLNNKKLFKELSARFIASETYTSPSAVIRLCKKIGYSGFNDFKEDYLKELDYKKSKFNDVNPNYPFKYSDSNTVIANKIATLYKETINDVLSLIDENSLTIATNILIKAKVIYICSSGAQADLAAAFEDKMSKIGKTVVVDSRLDRMFYAACYADETACFLMISYSGETEVLLRVAKKINEKKIPAIAITSFGENTLSELINCCLFVSTRESLVSNLGNFGINISALLLLDILYSNCFNFNYGINIRNKIKYSDEFEKKRHSKNSILNKLQSE